MSNRQRGEASPANATSEPSLAERGRTLVYLRNVGSLATLSTKHPDWPFGSVMPYALDDLGRPIFLISALAMHTQNLLRDRRASLLVTPPEVDDDPLGTARVTLMGTVTPVPQEARAPVRDGYLARHADASVWVDFGDFGFYRMEVTDIYFVGGFGVMGWVSAEDYYGAAVDPLADIAASILRHMNADHSEALVLMAQHFGACVAESARMTMVDRCGCRLQVTSANTTQSLRLQFPHQVRNANEVRQVLTAMTQQARAAGMSG